MTELPERIVTIFGGSKCDETDIAYAQARRTGQLLAEAGYTICTGGYLGVMEAASRGADEAGGRVLGIVMNQFKAEPNRYLSEKVATPHFYETAAKTDNSFRRIYCYPRRNGNRHRVVLSLEQDSNQSDRPSPVGPSRRLLGASCKGLANASGGK